MLHYVWLCDRKHLKGEELEENQNEKERKEGWNLHPNELHIPP